MKVLVTLVVTVLLLSSCRSKESIPLSAPQVVDGAPSEIYERALPAIRERMRSGTSVIRTDEADTLMMRFSLSAGDRSVRLVDVSLKRALGAHTEATVHSKKFTFVFGGKRDEVDRAVEEQILALLKKRPNQSSEPTPTSVTICAEPQIAPAAVAAHL